MTLVPAETFQHELHHVTLAMVRRRRVGKNNNFHSLWIWQMAIAFSQALVAAQSNGVFGHEDGDAIDIGKSEVSADLYP